MKTALITGITGQDGSYLADFLLNKDYLVHGIIRRASNSNVQRLKKIIGEKKFTDGKLILHYGDLSDANNVCEIIQKIKPDEIYNLAAQSDVGLSFTMPDYTVNINALGTLKILESIKTQGLVGKTKFYQASSSEIFGKVQTVPQTELTPFYPRSPYAVSKLFSYWITINYRESFNLFACNGILFNHESPIRGENFVTRKITKGLARIKLGLQDCLYLGNLNAKRDWGHARDYVEMQWLMLQQDLPEDFIISSGRQYSVRDFVNLTSQFLGIKIEWVGKDIDEKGYDESGRCIIEVDKNLFRPAEVESLLGDSRKAATKLGWKPKTSFEDLVKEMVLEDENLAKDELMKK